MKPEEKLSDAIGQIDEKYLEEADNWQQSLKQRDVKEVRRRVIAMAVSICLIAGSVFLGSALLNGKDSFTGENGNTEVPTILTEEENRESTSQEATPPETETKEQYIYIAPHDRLDNKLELIAVLDKMNAAMLAEKNFPRGKRDNPIYSPAGVYGALGALTKAGDGMTKLGTLTHMGSISEINIQALIEELNSQYNSSYEYNCQATMHQSIWYPGGQFLTALRKNQMNREYNVEFHPGLLEMQQMREELQAILEENTGWTFNDATCKMLLGDYENMVYISAANYEGEWYRNQLIGSEQGIFYGETGESDCTYIQLAEPVTVYFGNGFQMIQAQVGTEQLWLAVPEEGRTLEELMEKDGKSLAKILLNPSDWERKEMKQVKLSIPSFEAGAILNMQPILTDMGMHNLFVGQNTDYSPLVKNSGMSLSKFSQIIYLRMDEKGCNVESSGAPRRYEPEYEGEIVLNRPFYYAISSEGFLPLIAGTVYSPQK